LLLLLFLLPGILYWMAASRDVNFSITATPADGGCRLLFGGEYGAGFNEFRHWVRSLPKPEGAGRAAEVPVSARAGALVRNAGWILIGLVVFIVFMTIISQ